MWKLTAVTTLIATKFLRMHIAAVGKGGLYEDHLGTFRQFFIVFKIQCLLAVYSYLPSLWRFLTRTKMSTVSLLAAYPQSLCRLASVVIANYTVTLLDGFGHWNLLTDNSAVCSCDTAVINPELSLQALTLSLRVVSNTVGGILFSVVVRNFHSYVVQKAT